jgi:hypothetical protein
MWTKKIIMRDGRRFLAEVWIGEGCQEVRFKRELAAGEVWPPPKPKLQIESAEILSGADRNKLLRGIRGALVAEDSHLDEHGRAEAQKMFGWNGK